MGKGLEKWSEDSLKTRAGVTARGIHLKITFEKMERTCLNLLAIKIISTYRLAEYIQFIKK